MTSINTNLTVSNVMNGFWSSFKASPADLTDLAECAASTAAIILESSSNATSAKAARKWASGFDLIGNGIRAFSLPGTLYSAINGFATAKEAREYMSAAEDLSYAVYFTGNAASAAKDLGLASITSSAMTAMNKMHNISGMIGSSLGIAGDVMDYSEATQKISHKGPALLDKKIEEAEKGQFACEKQKAFWSMAMNISCLALGILGFIGLFTALIIPSLVGSIITITLSVAAIAYGVISHIYSEKAKDIAIETDKLKILSTTH